MAGKTKNRRTGGSGSVFQDSKGRWHFRKDMGTDPATGRRRPPIEATGMVKSEARARFQAKIAEWERDGRLPTKDGPKTADYFERWMEEHRTAVNPTTWRNESSWMRTMNAIIGNIRLNRLTADDINGMCRRLRRTRKSKTVNTYLAVLGAMLRTAKRDGLIADECRRTGTNAPSLTSPTQRRSSRPRSPSPIRRSPCSTVRTSVRSGHSCSNSPSPRACGRGRGMA